MSYMASLPLFLGQVVIPQVGLSLVAMGLSGIQDDWVQPVLLRVVGTCYLTASQRPKSIIGSGTGTCFFSRER